MNMSRDLAFQHVRGVAEPNIEEEISRLNRDRTAAATAASGALLDSSIISVLTNDGHHSILNGNSVIERNATRGGTE